MKLAQYLAFATVIMTLVLIAVGVLVRATGSGLGCPDWPTCHGGVVPPEHKHAMIEMSHRYTASLVGFMVIGVAALAWRHYRHVPAVFWTALLTVPLVGLQGLLGAITVVRELPPEIVATHLLTAMAVLSCQLTVAIGMYIEDPAHQKSTLVTTRAALRPAGRWALMALAWLAVTLWIGGYMTESGAATACSGWPLCNGSVLPAADDHEVTHMLHRYLAGLFVFFIAGFAFAAWRARDRVRWAPILGFAAVVLYTVQVVIGALNVWLTFPEPLTISHTVIASLVWFTLSSAALLAWYQPAAERRRIGSLARGKVPV
ncbi:MAG: COX15/CtaA family protein [Dehalococcoidia bacterium]|nr:COX15/CtaA family protein [Dehalococcoidia bacterium]MCB9485984.1 COX15/CtaA family protein [Thermoflexaceae bacterium]